MHHRAACLLPLVALAAPAQADVFASSGPPVSIPDTGVATDGLVVVEPLPIQDLDVLVALDHPRAQHLALTLVAPGDRRVELLAPGSLTGSVRLLCFDDEAPGRPLQGGVASLVPTTPLGRLDGLLASGRWTLEVTDVAVGSTGSIVNFALATNGRVQVGPQTAVPIVDFEQIELALDVPEGLTVGDLELGFSIEHTFPGDLVITLARPDGQSELLIPEGTFSAAVWRSVVLDDDADADISSAFFGNSGRWRSVSGESLDALTGTSAAGTWTLGVDDDAFGDIGQLDWWYLHFVDSDGQASPPSPTAWADPEATPAPPRLEPCDLLRLAGSDPAFDGDPAVAADAGRVAVGTEFDSEIGFTTGAVYLFETTVPLANEAAKLTPPNLSTLDRFGAAVALEGDRLVAGAPGNPFEGGRVFVFDRGELTWELSAELDVFQFPPSFPSSVFQAEGWGASVALEGSRAVVGKDQSFGVDAAVLWIEQDGLWNASQLLTPSLPAPGAFGWDVAIDSGLIVVGAPGLDGSDGSVHVFERVGGVWIETARLAPAQPQLGEDFGVAVDVERSVGGERIVVGAPGFQLGSGGVYVFERDGGAGAWIETALVTDAAPSSGFGRSVALDGERFAAGGLFGGRAVVHQRTPVGWQTLVTIDESNGLLSRSVDLLGDRLVVAGGPDQVLGSVFGLQSKQSLWSCTPSLSAQAGGFHDLELFAGPHAAGDLYVVLGSASGTAPGLPLGAFELPLVPDAYTTATLVLVNQPPFLETFGVLDALGRAQAAIELPAATSPALIGLELQHAAVAIDFVSAAPTFVTEAQGLSIAD